MYQDWLERYEEIANKRKDNIRTEDYCPMCGRKLSGRFITQYEALNKVEQVIYKYLKMQMKGKIIL